jgi:hypothetical protein
MNRATLIAERKLSDPEKLFRLLIIELSFPNIIDALIIEDENNQNMPLFEKLIPNEKERENFQNLLYDQKKKYGGRIEVEDIKEILGK